MYTQHALRPFIDSESNHIRRFIKIPFIYKGIDFIDLPCIFPVKIVIKSIPSYFQNSKPPIICYKYNKKVQVGKDQEKKIPTPKTEVKKKKKKKKKRKKEEKKTTRHPHHENTPHNQSEILFLISINLFLILISMLILLSLDIVKIQNMLLISRAYSYWKFKNDFGFYISQNCF